MKSPPLPRDVDPARRILDLHRAGDTGAEIARKLGLNLTRVYRTLRKAGAKLEPHPARVKVNAEAIHAHYLESGSAKRTAEAFGVSESVVKNRIRRQGGALRDRTLKIPIAEVIRLYQQRRMTVTEVAKQLGCSTTAIRKRLRLANTKIRDRGDALRSPNGTTRWRPRQRQVVFKTGGRWKKASTHIWERTHGPAKPGCRIVRIDRRMPPATIDSIENLAMARKSTLATWRWPKQVIPDDAPPERRHELLIISLLIAALKTGDTDLKLGTDLV